MPQTVFSASACLVRLLLGGVLVVLLLGLAGCSRAPEPVKVGFVGTLTGRISDLGVGVRNGVLLAVDAVNEAGGIAGRPLELIVRDDANDPETARRVLEELAAKGVVAVIGHTSSSMSVASLPALDDLGLILLSPTSTSNALSGLDDLFFRVSQPHGIEAELHARFILEELGVRSVLVVHDMANAAFTEDWISHFHPYFLARGGNPPGRLPFISGETPVFSQLAEEVRASGAEAVVIIAGAVDTAMLCQHLALRDVQAYRLATGWVMSPELFQRGGRSVEGLYVSHVHDDQHPGEAFQAFRRAYQDRYQNLPGFGAAYGYDAVIALGLALERAWREEGNFSTPALKDALLQVESYPGLQGDFSLDRHGDPWRAYHMSRVVGREFARVDAP